MSNSDRQRGNNPADGASALWSRRMVFACLGLVLLQASAWQVAGVLVILGQDDFLIFGTDASMVIEAMPAYTMGIVAGVYQAMIVGVIALVGMRRKRAISLLLVATGLHVLIWVRVSFNPYVPAWPGLIIFTAEMLSLVLLYRQARSGFLR